MSILDEAEFDRLCRCRDFVGRSCRTSRNSSSWCAEFTIKSSYQPVGMDLECLDDETPCDSAAFGEHMDPLDAFADVFAAEVERELGDQYGVVEPHEEAASGLRPVQWSTPDLEHMRCPMEEHEYECEYEYVRKGQWTADLLHMRCPMEELRYHRAGKLRQTRRSVLSSCPRAIRQLDAVGEVDDIPDRSPDLEAHAMCDHYLRTLKQVTGAADTPVPRDHSRPVELPFIEQPPGGDARLDEVAGTQGVGVSCFGRIASDGPRPQKPRASRSCSPVVCFFREGKQEHCLFRDKEDQELVASRLEEGVRLSLSCGPAERSSTGATAPSIES